MDQILPLFDHQLPKMDKRGHLRHHLPYVHVDNSKIDYHLPNVDNCGHLANYHLPHFVHVVIERPLSVLSSLLTWLTHWFQRLNCEKVDSFLSSRTKKFGLRVSHFLQKSVITM